MKSLNLNEIYLGKIDAYNEFLEYGQEIFKELFFEYPNFDLNAVLNGSIYYICGDKGTGKTMLLKYIESIIYENNALHFSEFIRFKKDIDEEQRNLIKRASIPNQSFEEIIDKNIPSDTSINCTLAWQVYLIKVIIKKLRNTENAIFDQGDKNWIDLSYILDAVYDEPKEGSSIKKIIPKIKKGNVEINFAKYGKLQLDLEWNDEEKKSVPFNTIAKRIIDLYSSLKVVGEARLHILIDELELSLIHKKQYIRDVTLIRDLIFSVQYMSEISKIKGYNIYFISAIRNEVYKEAASKGLEVNKPIHDFGFQIEWTQKGGDIKEHPLLKMLEKRIIYSEKQKNIEQCDDIWEKYFIDSIRIGSGKSINIFNYILDQTWYRPRDIIRMFTIIQSKYGNRNFIDKEVFDGVRQRYAQESWEEFEEILTAKYSDKETVGIRHALTGLAIPFTVQNFAEQIDGKAQTFSEVEELQKKNVKPQQVLRILYDIGVIGNDGDFSRFSFKGEPDIDPLSPLTIHYPLRRFFKSQSRHTKALGVNPIFR